MDVEDHLASSEADHCVWVGRSIVEQVHHGVHGLLWPLAWASDRQLKA